MKPAIACIGLGSNLAHPRRQIARAIRAIARLAGCRILCVSPNYVSAPVGCELAQPDFINAVAAISTTLVPRALLRRLLAIEHRHKRHRAPGGPRNAPRTLDLDLLLYGRRQIRTAQLTVPHPRMTGRAFVLRPLADILPAATIPRRGLARRHLRYLSGQRIRRTRTHSIQ